VVFRRSSPPRKGFISHPPLSHSPRNKSLFCKKKKNTVTSHVMAARNFWRRPLPWDVGHTARTMRAAVGHFIASQQSN
jgi:hypothetical protein